MRCRRYRQRNDFCRHEQVAPIVTAHQILPAGTVAIHLPSRLQVWARSQRGLWPEDTAYAFPSFSNALCLPCAAQPTREALLLSASCDKSLLPCHLSKRESTFSLRQYFQNNCHALKIFFHALKKFFQGMKKVFQALEKFFPSTRVFLENIEDCFLRICVPGSTFKHAPYRLIMW